ncbi:MAG: hypothetical protein ABR923_05500 [Terracidiphilus sp.]|jgi:hypothetical protein
MYSENALIAKDDRFSSALGAGNIKASMYGRESLNTAAEPGREFPETDLFEVAEFVRAKNRCNAGRLEAGDRISSSLSPSLPMSNFSSPSAENHRGHEASTSKRTSFWVLGQPKVRNIASVRRQKTRCKCKRFLGTLGHQKGRFRKDG